MDNNDSNSEVFVGRLEERKKIYDFLKQNQSNICLLIGESGVGKTYFLDKVYSELTQNSLTEYCVGYYDHHRSLIAESASLTYPFNCVLESLVNSINLSSTLREKSSVAFKRITKGIIKTAKSKSRKLALAVLSDIVHKIGLEQTFELGKEVVENIIAEKTGSVLAREYIMEHRDELLESYVEIITALHEEFKERKFVLIFDQFEYVGKSSTDFLLNLAKFLRPIDGVYLIVSFKSDRTNTDPSFKILLEDFLYKIRSDLKGEVIELNGLDVIDIDTWIRSVRNISLPMIPSLIRIRENSGGLPIILDEWIRSSKDCKDFDYINVSNICLSLAKLGKSLSKKHEKHLYFLSILEQPFGNTQDLLDYLGIDDIYDLHKLYEVLFEYRIFYKPDQSVSNDYTWFRHELIQKCISKNMNEFFSRSCHDMAAQFFEKLADSRLTKNGESLVISNKDECSICIACVYHIHKSGNRKRESFNKNASLAKISAEMGDLNIAEKCYIRAIKDAQEIQKEGAPDVSDYLANEMWCRNELALRVYETWGRYNDALINYNSFLEHAKQVNNPRMISRGYNNIGMILNRLLDFDNALEMYEKSLAISKKIGERDMIAVTLDNMGAIYNQKGNLEKAYELYEEGLNYADTNEAKMALKNDMADILNKKWDFNGAFDKLTESLVLAESMGDLNKICMVRYNIGTNLEHRRRFDEAFVHYKESFAVATRLGAIRICLGALNGMGNILRHKEENDKAIEYYKESLGFALQLGDKSSLGIILNNIGTSFLMLGDNENALNCLMQAKGMNKTYNTAEYALTLRLISGIIKNVGESTFNTLENIIKDKLASGTLKSYI